MLMMGRDKFLLVGRAGQLGPDRDTVGPCRGHCKLPPDWRSFRDEAFGGYAQTVGVTWKLRVYDLALSVLVLGAIVTLFAAIDYNDLSEGQVLDRDERLVSGFALTYWYGLPLLAIACACFASVAGRVHQHRLGKRAERAKVWAICVAAASLVAWVLYYVLGTESARLN
jgi:hypothetical protein